MIRILTLLLAVLLIPTVSTAGSPCGEHVRWLGTLELDDDPLDLAWAGNNLAIAAGAEGLIIVDPGDLFEPVVLGSEPAVEVTRVEVVGDLAFVTNAAPGRFAIIDISDPANPTLLAERATASYAYELAVVGDYAFIVIVGPNHGPPRGIEQFDISDPYNPQSLGIWLDEMPNTIAYHAGYLYVGLYWPGNGMQIYDAGDPAAPTLVGSVPGLNVTSIFVDGDLLYASAASRYSSEVDEVLTINIADRSNPQVVHSTPLFGEYTFGLDRAQTTRYGDHLLVANAVSFEFLDLSDPYHPTQAFRTHVPGWGESLVVGDGIAYLADRRNGVQAYDVRSAEMPRVAATVPNLNPYAERISIEVSGNHAYYMEQDAGLRILDISTPVAPVPLALVPTSNRNYDLALEGNRAYVSNQTHGVSIVDITIPSAPVILGAVATQVSPKGIAVNGNLVYVADDWGGLQILDVSDPTAGFVVSTTPLAGYANRVAYVDGLAYVCTRSGLEIVDVSDPGLPVLRGSFVQAPTGFGDLLVDGDLAYCLGPNLSIIDVSDPDAPALIASLELGAAWSAGGITLTNGHLLLGTDWGMMIVDVRDPAVPGIVTQGVGGDRVRATAFHNGHALLGAADEGFEVVPLDCELPVPVLFGGLSLRLQDDRVLVRWESSDPDATNFRLVARHASTSSDVEFEWFPGSGYLATDLIRERTGRIDYTVYHRHGGAWEPMGQSALEIPAKARTQLVRISPNPFNPRTTIELALANPGPARVTVHDMRGALVRVLAAGPHDAGRFFLEWDGRDQSGAPVGSGSYVIRLETPDTVESQKALLLK